MTVKLRILAVEDHDDDFFLLEKQLAGSLKNKFDLCRAKSLKQALGLLDSNDFEVILLDLGLPGTRQEATFQPLFNKVGTRIPIIVVTDSDQPELISRLMSSGAQDFLNKDEVNPKILNRSIQYAMDRFCNQRAMEDLVASLESTENELLQVAKIEAVGRLAVGLVHQFKNPLGTLAFGLNFLENRHVEDPIEKEVIEGMKRNLDRIDRIVSELLDFSPAAEYDPEECDIRKVIGCAIDMINHRLNEKENTISFSVDLDYDEFQITADSNKLQHAIVNMLENAIDAVNEQDDKEIAIRYQQGPDTYVKVVVTDNGIGVPAQDLEKVTDPFFTTKRTSGGTGLGLSVVKRIARLHGGRFNISSTSGQTIASISVLKASEKLSPTDQQSLDEKIIDFPTHSKQN